MSDWQHTLKVLGLTSGPHLHPVIFLKGTFKVSKHIL